MRKTSVYHVTTTVKDGFSIDNPNAIGPVVRCKTHEGDRKPLDAPETLSCQRIQNTLNPVFGQWVGEMFVATDNPAALYDLLGTNNVLNVNLLGIGYVADEPKQAAQPAAPCPFKAFAKLHLESFLKVMDQLDPDKASKGEIAAWIYKTNRAGDFAIYVSSNNWGDVAG